MHQYYGWHTYDNYETYYNKEVEFYNKKQQILEKYFSPICIHRQKINKKIRIYDYEKEYDKNKHKNLIIWENSYYDYEMNRYVNFYDIPDKNTYIYFIYYEISDKGYHTPIDNKLIKDMKKLYEIKDLLDDFYTEGTDINELLSVQFSNKVYEYIMNNENITIQQ